MSSQKANYLGPMNDNRSIRYELLEFLTIKQLLLYVIKDLFLDNSIFKETGKDEREAEIQGEKPEKWLSK